VPFDPGLLTIDRGRLGYDCRSGEPLDNHHLIVGNRHKKIIEEAATAGLDNVCVLEDDAEFVSADARHIASILDWVRQNRNRWDVFYLGFCAPFFTRCSFVKRRIVRANRPFFAHAIVYNRRIYDQVLAVDFSADHRPRLFRAVEWCTSGDRRTSPYFRHGVGSLDTWLSFSRLRKYAAHPMLVVQTALPPGTELAWKRRTGREYDFHATPRHQVMIALGAHYGALGLAALAAIMTFSSCVVW
jgi:hypothetical protein